MLSTLLCTMFLTLGVDIGWIPAEDGKSDIYVIQIHPDQGRRMIDDKGYIDSEIPPGTREIRVQFRDEVLAKHPLHPPLTTSRLVEDHPKPEEPKRSEPPLATPPPTTSSDIVTTSLSAPAEVTPPQTSKPIKNTIPQGGPPQENPSTAATAATETHHSSYLTTAIVSWVVSAALLAVIIYIAMLYLDLRQRYQSLLDRTLLATDPPAPADRATQPSQPVVPSELPPSAGSPVPEPPMPEPPAPAPLEIDSTSEAATRSSTLVESALIAAKAEDVDEIASDPVDMVYELPEAFDDDEEDEWEEEEEEEELDEEDEDDEYELEDDEEEEEEEDELDEGDEEEDENDHDDKDHWKGVQP